MHIRKPHEEDTWKKNDILQHVSSGSMHIFARLHGESFESLGGFIGSVPFYTKVGVAVFDPEPLKVGDVVRRTAVSQRYKVVAFHVNNSKQEEVVLYEMYRNEDEYGSKYDVLLRKQVETWERVT